MKKNLLFLSILALIVTSCAKHEFRTEQITYNKATVLPNSPNDSLIINIEIEYPTDMENPDVLPLIQKDLLNALLDDNEVQTTDGEKEVLNFAHRIEHGYLETLKDDQNDSLGIDSWEKDIVGRVMSIRNDMLSYSHEDYTFTGGAHGYNSRHFYNYDLKTGRFLTENDIFTAGYETILTGLLIQNFIEQSEEFESVEDIMQSDYSIEYIVPNNNFYFTEEELVYVFNAYEIAPYYRGETEISIPLAQVNDLLK